ncbi:MAG: hypothetical protein NC489_34840 [Ruminococcus flavefaciens]|nr:hypothetical protein [Ruminococcus flavefaciens]
MNQETIKKLCKILKVIGYFFVGGGYFGGVFISEMAEKNKEGMIMKGMTLVLFFGVLFLVPQDVLDKREKDELGDFSFQSIVPSIKLCAALLFSLYLVIMAWTHNW